MLAEDILADLERELPPVVLLLGNPDVIQALSRSAFLAHDMKLSDLRWSQKVTAEVARQVVAEASLAPDGDFLAFVLHLDGASEQAQTILLKVVEEPPETCRFILLSSTPPLPALASRCVAYRVNDKWSEQVSEESSVAAATAAVRAALTKDPAALAEALRPWGEKCSCRAGKPHDKGDHYLVALQAWAVSQASRYRIELFPGQAADPPVQARTARTVLRVLTDYPRARSQNAAAAALSLAFLEDT